MNLPFRPFVLCFDWKNQLLRSLSTVSLCTVISQSGILCIFLNKEHELQFCSYCRNCLSKFIIESRKSIYDVIRKGTCSCWRCYHSRMYFWLLVYWTSGMSCSRCLAGQATPLPQVDRNVAWHRRQHSKEVTLGIFLTVWIFFE